MGSRNQASTLLPPVACFELVTPTLFSESRAAHRSIVLRVDGRGCGVQYHAQACAVHL